MNYIINDLNKLNKFAEAFSKSIEKGDVFTLDGDLGAGKTTLVQKIGKFLGVEDYITSPTFSLVNIYDGKCQINHLDLYRLEDPDELLQIDFESYFYPEGISFIEWPDKGGDYIPDDRVDIKIRLEGENRVITIDDSERGKEIKEIIDENFSN